MSNETYYTVLGVSETATQLEIKAAYRNLLKQIHPDTVSTLSPELRRVADDVTKDINEAYSVLSDANKRRQYDRKLWEHRHKSVPPPTTPDVPRGPRARHQTSQAASNGRRRQRAYHYGNSQHSSRLRRWADRHPALAGLLVCVLGILCVVILMLLFSLASSLGVT